MKPTIIIDGYNLIHRVKELREFLRIDIQHARTELINKLAGLISRKNINIRLVFDGDRVGQPSHQSINRIQIIYSIKPQIADTVIKQFVDKSKNPKNLLVVSSDSSVYQYAKSAKAQAIRSEEFYAKYFDSKKSSTSPNLQQEMSKDELQNWINIFNNTDGNEK